jgi:hypothetical protein
VSEALVARCGALLVWRADQAPPEPIAALTQGRTRGSMSMRYPQAPEAAPLAIGYAIAPPNAAAAREDCS